MDPLISQGTALITGSGSGIGQQIAVTFARQGCAKLFLVDISKAGLEKTRDLVASENTKAVVVCHIADITDDLSVREMVESCVKTFGRIDFACNNAGAAMPNILTTDIPTDTFDKVFNVNFKGIHLCHKYQIPAMAKQEPLDIQIPGRPGANLCRGSIVNTASMAGLGILGGLSAYNASKHGVVTTTRVDARQFAEQGLRINCVCPGFVDTPMLRGSGLSEDYLEAAKSQSPMRRFVQAAEIADGVIFLSGSCASAVTGISLPVDGGALLYHIV